MDEAGNQHHPAASTFKTLHGTEKLEIVHVRLFLKFQPDKLVSFEQILYEYAWPHALSPGAAAPPQGPAASKRRPPKPRGSLDRVKAPGAIRVNQQTLARLDSHAQVC